MHALAQLALAFALAIVASACLSPTKQEFVPPVQSADAAVDGSGAVDAATGASETVAEEVASTGDVAADAPADAVDAAAPCTSDEACAAVVTAPACQYVRCLPTAGGPAACQLLPEKDGKTCGDAECLVQSGAPILQARQCQAGACTTAAVTTPCADGDPCTTDGCTAASGCTHSFVDCADDNACTKDACDAQAGCTHVAADASPCDDGNQCTLNDACNGEQCQGGATKDCAQTSPCQYASCVASSGLCVAAPLADGQPCDDGNPCTPKDGCKAGNCAGTGNACDDGNACTIDGCANGGCQHSPSSGPCDLDASLCTADLCAGETCSPGKVLTCDDGNPCTVDGCAKATGCSHVPAAFASPCGTAKWCGKDAQKSQCVAAPTVAGMTLVAGATYTQGCNAAVDPWCNPNEKPAHPVAIASYYIDTNEVTVAQYQACVTGGACVAPGTGTGATWGQTGKSQHPVNFVSWAQANTYCLWAGGGRLCSEAEWEFAARGSDGRRFPWGNTPATGCDLANWGGSCGGLQPVGQLPKGKSPFGLYDMAGNIREWTADWYAGGYYAELAAAGTLTTAPAGPKTGSERSVRGGYFQDNMPELRTSARAFAQPATSAFSLGIRCCRSPK